MSTCLERYNTSLIPNSNITWGELDRATLQDFSYTSYFRPDSGVALFPWAYTILFLVTHVPVVFVRVVRFDHVQYFCIGSAILSVYLTIQGYVSTDFAAPKILLWTPLLLVIDAGAMLQVFFLVVEGVAVKVGDRTILMEPGDAPENDVNGLPQSEPLGTSLPKRFGALRNRIRPPREKDIEGEVLNDDREVDESSSPSPWPARIAASLSAILFIIIVVLQLLGLRAVFGKGGLREAPQATWCSPLFQPFGIAVLDGDCDVYPVNRRLTEGIGCIKLPGLWQREWFWISAIGTILCLFAQLVDLVLMALVNGKSKVGGAVKLKRPWSTMILGLAAICITLFFGVEYSNMLPPGITRRVLIVADVGHPMGFEGTLVTAGLRGALIGWSDGLFTSWGKAYFGS